MKKLVISLAVVLLWVTNSLMAQEMVTEDWDTYGMQFQIPKNFEIEENNATRFRASDPRSKMLLVIAPVKDATMTVEDIAKMAFDKVDLDNKTYTEKKSLTLNGYKGYYYWGKGKGLNRYAGKDNMGFFSMGLMDPSSTTNFRVTVYWDKDSGANEDKIAIKVANSFTKLKK